VSSLEELSQSGFQHVIPDAEHQKAGRVLLCCGKIYFELIQQRTELKRQDVALIRLEQLYPFPQEALGAALKSYADQTRFVWVQEEPENMGAWRYMQMQLGNRLRLECVSRPESASPAAGSAARHKQEQKALLSRAFLPD